MTPTPAVLAVALYAGLNGLILFWLAAHVGRTRQKRGIFIGDGGDPVLVRAMRGQLNFVEYVPYCLILLGLTAAIGAPVWVVHLLGVALTAGRLLHGLHFVQSDAPGWQRGAGAGLTLLVLVLGSIGLIAHALVRML